MSTEKNQEDINALEAALASLVPRTDRLNRDRLLFLAGQQSTTGLQPIASRTGLQPVQKIHSNRAWPLAFTGMSAIAATLFLLLLFRPNVQVVEHVEETPSEPTVQIAKAETPVQESFQEESSSWESYRGGEVTFLRAFFIALFREDQPSDEEWNPSLVMNSHQSQAAILKRLNAGKEPFWEMPPKTSSVPNPPSSPPPTKQQLLKQYLEEGTLGSG